MRKVSSDKNKYKDHKGPDSLSTSKNEPLRKKNIHHWNTRNALILPSVFPIFLSTTNTLNPFQLQFQNQLIIESENALLFPCTLPCDECLLKCFPVLFTYRLLVEITDTKVGQPLSSTPFWEGSVFLQIEPSMAFQFGLPILLVREANTTQILELGQEELPTQHIHNH